MNRLTASILVVAASVAGCSAVEKLPEPAAPITVMKDGGYCWYQDPRALIANAKLVVGGIDGQNGDVKVSVYDLKENRDLGTVILHEKFEADDHDAPALYLRPDGRILAMYTKHAVDRQHRYRISEPDNYLVWGEEKLFTHEYEGGWGVTYMNLLYMQNEGLLYNFFRDGLNINPSFITSSDRGETWGNRTHFISDDLDWQRPYARYLQCDANTVGISFTDAHPRQYGNSLYYAEFSSGGFYKADGSKIKDLTDGPLRPSESERIYKGSHTKKKPKGYESVPGSAWTCAMAVDAAGHPHLGYTLYLDNDDHRYRMAFWNGKRWVDREIAHAGTCLYPAESSYTGLIAIDPVNPEHVVISSDVDPSSGKDLGGKHELYSATIGPEDNIHSIDWNSVTRDSEVRNIRPMIVTGDGYKVLVWMCGRYTTYTDYDCDVFGILLESP